MGENALAYHRLNLAFRFLLELAALIGFGRAAWVLMESWLRWPAAFFIPLTVAAIWGVFAVPEDRSRSGFAPVPVRGSVRLILEFAILFGGAHAFHIAGAVITGAALTAAIVVHYLLSWDRVRWLLTGRHSRD
jgi:hypothetical protein